MTMQYYDRFAPHGLEEGYAMLVELVDVDGTVVPLVQLPAPLNRDPRSRFYLRVRTIHRDSGASTTILDAPMESFDPT